MSLCAESQGAEKDKGKSQTYRRWKESERNAGALFHAAVICTDNNRRVAAFDDAALAKLQQAISKRRLPRCVAEGPAVSKKIT